MTDLIERLRDPKERVYPDDLMDEAADRIEQLEGELVKWRASDDAHREQAERWKTAFYHGKQRVEELEAALRENGKAFGMYGDHVRQAGCYAIAEDRE